ncbi:MAG TPA: ribosomal protein L16, partial [Flavobacterium sp.]|nr:ribosomal protein L16 [Flavobacterium sp.]
KFPDFVLTSKPKEMRMGKGKGAPAKRVAVLKNGSILLVLRNRGGVSFYLVERLLEMLSKKIPFKHKIIKNF